MRAKIIVRLKTTVHDPQGEAIWQSLQHLGFANVSNVRQGKIFDLELENIGAKEAGVLLEEIAHRVLANPIIEEYVIEVEEKS